MSIWNKALQKKQQAEQEKKKNYKEEDEEKESGRRYSKGEFNRNNEALWKINDINETLNSALKKNHTISSLYPEIEKESQGLSNAIHIAIMQYLQPMLDNIKEKRE